MALNKNINNYFKIIAGDYRGRKFNFHDTKGLRPTTARIRETLFNWLREDIIGKTVLDPFAGSGSLIFEAISRGASKIYAIEKNKKTFNQLNKNLNIFNKEKFTIINTDAIKHLQKKSNKSFDLVFMDPPFAQDILPKVLNLIFNNGYVTNGSKIYIESEFEINKKELTIIDSYSCNIYRQKKSGSVNYCLINIE